MICKVSKLTVAITASISLLLSPFSFSQNRESEVTEIVVEGSYLLSDRIDTATGLGLTIRETPQSVSIFTSQRILDQNLDTIADVALNATGVTVNEIDDVRNTFSARGFDINNYQVDGVPLAYSLAGGAGETMLDAVIYERIEIVRGATGLLTGVGDPSASINLVRKGADFDELTGYVNVGLGRWNNQEVSADVGSALNQTGSVRGRLVGKVQQSESFVNLFEDQKYIFYGIVEADLSDQTSLEIGASHQEESPTAPAWGALPSFDKSGEFIHWPRSQTSSANWTYWDTTNQNAFVNISHEFSDKWQLNADFNWIKNAQQTEILYLFVDSFSAAPGVDRSSGLGLASYPYSDEGNNTQHSLDIQLKGFYDLFNSEHEIVMGALYSEQNYVNETFSALAFPAVGDYNALQDGSFPNPSFTDVAFLAVDMDTEQEAFYAATRLNFTESFKAIIGGRVSSWQREGFSFGPEFDFGDDNVFIPYAGFLYDVTENHTLYTSYTEIFQPQNAQDRMGSYLDPLTGSSFEFGLKSDFLDGALQTSIAVFNIKQDNLAEIDPGQLIPGTIFEASRAVKGASSDGYEFEVIGNLTDDWNITVGFSDFDATDANGVEVNTDHPRKLLKIFSTYSFTDSVPGLTLGGGVNWQDKMYSDALSTTGAPFRLQQDSYALVNLMARYEVNEHLTVQANIDNASDKTFFTQVGFFDQYRYGSPRNYMLSLNYAF